MVDENLNDQNQKTRDQRRDEKGEIEKLKQ
jgi:hypothetical protein